jgi:hypothetical protein
LGISPELTLLNPQHQSNQTKPNLHNKLRNKHYTFPISSQGTNVDGYTPDVSTFSSPFFSKEGPVLLASPQQQCVNYHLLLHELILGLSSCHWVLDQSISKIFLQQIPHGN